MKRWFLLLVVAVVFAVGTTALAQETTQVEPWTCPEDVLNLENKTLNFLNWATYIAENTVPDFEAACGVKVTTDFYGSNEELLARMRAGNPGFDLIVPSGYTVAEMIAEGLLEPLDKANIPNIKNISPDLLGRQFDPGNVYSLPYQWGTVGIGYNVKAVAAVLGEDVEITSWNQLFDYPVARVGWLDDQRVMLGIGLLMLGYDPNSANPDEIREATDYLVEKGRKNVLRIAVDDGQELLARGEVDMVIEYSGDIFQVALACEEDPNCGTEYAYILPDEGANMWIDNLVIPTRAQNKRLAEAFIDYVLHPQVGADISNYIAYATPNQVSIDAGLIDEYLLESPIIYPTADVFERLFVTEAFADMPEVQQYYNDAWDELKIFVAR
ncbi:MAG: spermidine/putrescine ABC transporter substrate-binding protein [Chloroflexi bacterium]|nr:spermidine/putrescine ABC transporter substrate-binding protein [Chloroflexota bacterium]MDL1883633.1 spermidine/putrescine ABC transporter substrate-binding protein [Anaerolineae bacterium CFX8]